MSKRVFNFSAGPSALPEEVLLQAQKDLFSFPEAGMSVMEMSHRSESYQKIIDEAEKNLRKLMSIPENYSVLFLQGGASQQFSAVPMNLMHRGEKAAYVLSGNFSKKALAEAQRWGTADVVASSAESNFTYIPEIDISSISEEYAYLHVTGNNTIYGSCFYEYPKAKVPLVCDYSSAILGLEIDVNDFGLIYAGAQKNMGPAGLTVVIVKNDIILNPVDDIVPTMLRYAPQIKAGSMYNTPPCWSIYVAGLVYKWILEQGGVAEMEKRNRKKASLLYDLIDNSHIFNNPVRKKDRSIMNVVFTLPDSEMTKKFLAFAESRNIRNVKGHRAVGGCRASIYNGMTFEGVKALAECMEDFEKGKF